MYRKGGHSQAEGEALYLQPLKVRSGQSSSVSTNTVNGGGGVLYAGVSQSACTGPSVLEPPEGCPEFGNLGLYILASSQVSLNWHNSLTPLLIETSLD